LSVHHLDRHRPFMLALATAAAALAGACSTVALGDPPAGTNSCRPSQAFFVERVWGEFLSVPHGGKTCADAACHDDASGRLLRLVPIDPSDPTTVPLAPGTSWELNYRSATQQMNCTNVRASELFTRPAGLVLHGVGGALIDPISGPEGPLLDMWVAASP
jgi:hypothetical protein